MTHRSVDAGPTEEARLKTPDTDSSMTGGCAMQRFDSPWSTGCLSTRIIARFPPITQDVPSWQAGALSAGAASHALWLPPPTFGEPQCYSSTPRCQPDKRSLPEARPAKPDLQEVFDDSALGATPCSPSARGLRRLDCRRWRARLGCRAHDAAGGGADPVRYRAHTGATTCCFAP